MSLGSSNNFTPKRRSAPYVEEIGGASNQGAQKKTFGSFKNMKREK